MAEQLRDVADRDTAFQKARCRVVSHLIPNESRSLCLATQCLGDCPVYSCKELGFVHILTFPPLRGNQNRRPDAQHLHGVSVSPPTGFSGLSCVMKLGLIADIHEHVDNLCECLRLLKSEGVDQIAMLGDVYEMGHRIRPTCDLLASETVVGVWGNHDFGLCVNPTPEMHQNYGDVVIGYMTSLKARMVIDDCYFSHIEPWLNSDQLEDLWFFDGMPENAERRQQIFGAQPQRVFFAGHYHRWLLVSPDRTEAWDGSTPICLKEGRHFVVLDALVNGSFATYDTVSGWLIPHRLMP